MPEYLKIAVFASGKGSNLKAIIDAINSKELSNVEITCVISNRKDAGALEIARVNGIPAYFLNLKDFSSEEEFVSEVLQVLQRHSVNFIVLAGYLKLLNPLIVKSFRNRILNIHPALLPKYGGKGMYGLNVHRAVLANGEKYSGVTVHIVDEEYDHGPIIMQEKVEISPDETPESLEKKIQLVEHRIYPQAIKLFADEKIKIGSEIIINDK